jgi:signal transduction histidine kinase
VCNAVSLWTNLRAIDEAVALVDHTWTVIDHLHGINTLITGAQESQRSYLALSDEVELEALPDVKRDMTNKLAGLDRLVADNPTQKNAAEHLERLMAERLNALDTRIQLFRAGDRSRAFREAFRVGNRETRNIRLHIDNMIATEKALYEVRKGKVKVSQERTRLITAALSMTLMFLLLGTYFVLRRNMERRVMAEQALRAVNEQLESTVQQRTSQLSQLSWRLTNLAETEKLSLANELHDEMGANLTAINLDMSGVETALRDTQPALAARLQRALKVLQETVAIKRRIIHNLRPSLLDTLGVGPALNALCEDYTRRTGRPCAVEVADFLGELEPQWPITIYRVAQECLTNITKYADAHHVEVSLLREELGVRLKIIDDGVGIADDSFDRPLSHGLRGMRERVRQFGGLFAIRRNPDAPGTIAEAFLPFPGLVLAP